MAAGRPTTYWGKLRKDPAGNPVSWLPLIDHMTDVAVVFASLLEHGYGKPLATVAGQPLCRTQIARLSVLVFLHDVGKAHTDFQLMAFPERRDEILVRGHVLSACALFDVFGDSKTRQAFMEALSFVKMKTWVEDPESLPRLLLASWGHHGKPPEFTLVQGCLPSDARNVRWTGIEGWDIRKFFNDLSARVNSCWPEAFDTAPPLRVSSRFLHEFNGLVTLADWMGSDTRFFPYETPGSFASRKDFASVRIKRMLKVIGREASLKTAEFPVIFGFPPNTIQAALMEVSRP